MFGGIAPPLNASVRRAETIAMINRRLRDWLVAVPYLALAVLGLIGLARSYGVDTLGDDGVIPTLWEQGLGTIALVIWSATFVGAAMLLLGRTYARHILFGAAIACWVPVFLYARFLYATSPQLMPSAFVLRLLGTFVVVAGATAWLLYRRKRVIHG